MNKIQNQQKKNTIITITSVSAVCFSFSPSRSASMRDELLTFCLTLPQTETENKIILWMMMLELDGVTVNRVSWISHFRCVKSEANYLVRGKRNGCRFVFGLLRWACGRNWSGPGVYRYFRIDKRFSQFQTNFLRPLAQFRCDSKPQKKNKRIQCWRLRKFISRIAWEEAMHTHYHRFGLQTLQIVRTNEKIRHKRISHELRFSYILNFDLLTINVPL